MDADPKSPLQETTPSAFHAASCSALPPVLDACCGPRMMWVNKKDPRAIYYDRRNEDYEIKPNAAYPNGTTLKVRPDVQGDFGAMPFPDDSFRLVVFDPPHFTQIGLTGVLGMTYGKLFPDWEDGIAAGFRECFRVLKPEGVLIFKWCSVQIPLERVLALAPHPPLFGHNTGHRAQTHWMTFMKPNVSDQTPRTQDVANTTDSLERLSASVLFGLLLLVGFISGPSSVGAQETPIDHPRPAESHRTTDKMDNTGNPIILGNEAEPRLEALSADTYGKSAFGSFGEPSPQTSGTAHSALESSLTDQVGSLSGGERASESTMQARRLSPTGFVLLGVIVQLLLMAATWSNVVPVEHPKWLSLNIRYTAVAVLITMLLQPYVLSLVSSLESSGALIHCPNVSDQTRAEVGVADTTDALRRVVCIRFVRPVVAVDPE